MIDLGRVLRYAVERGASDVHLKVPSPPAVRIHGLLQRIPKAPPLKPPDTERFLQEMLGPYPDKLQEFAETGGDGSPPTGASCNSVCTPWKSPCAVRPVSSTPEARMRRR